MPVDDDDGRHRVNALADGVADLCLLLGRGAIFLCQVLGDVLATSGHLRVEFKRLNVELGPYIAGQIYQRPLKGRQADGTPGAGDVGDEIDLEQRSHGAGPEERR